MPNFLFEYAKALEALVYVSQRTPGHDLYKALKALYVADKLHLSKYGRFIYGETYAALPLGPVPQAAYDAARSLNQPWRSTAIPLDLLKSALVLEGRVLRPLRDPDIDELSKSDVECLDDAVRDLAFDSMETIKAKTHDSAWRKTPGTGNISVDDIIDTLPDDRREAVRSFLSE